MQTLILNISLHCGHLNHDRMLLGLCLPLEQQNIHFCSGGIYYAGSTLLMVWCC